MDSFVNEFGLLNTRLFIESLGWKTCVFCRVTRSYNLKIGPGCHSLKLVRLESWLVSGLGVTSDPTEISQVISC